MERHIGVKLIQTPSISIKWSGKPRGLAEQMVAAAGEGEPRDQSGGDQKVGFATAGRLYFGLPR